MAHQANNQSNRRRVVVTGVGAITPLASGFRKTWQGLLAGQSGISRIEHFDTSDYPVKICGAVKDFQAGDWFSPKDARKMDIFLQYGMAAAVDAMQQAGLEITDALSPRAGVAFGSGIGGITAIQDTVGLLEQKGPRRVSPFFIPSAITNMIAGWLSMQYNLRGPNYAITTACTTGTHCIGMAARTIAWGDADVMIAGGAEKGSASIGIAGFSAARALSANNDNPEAASRPWDRDRDGFVLSDGAGAVVLESLEHAQSRGATILAELTGFAMSGDAHHMTTPPEDGHGAVQAMQGALRDAGLNESEIDYINAHGTSTPAGDVVESRAIEQVFGDHARKLAVSSTKSMTGHLLGAAGALEAAIVVQALQEQVAPPTINLDNPDEGCVLDYVPHEARAMTIRHALSNSFGFGGTNATLAFSRFE
ncbi:beta-ketoacyl-ACP synthase II [Parendozoicomonas haliclonae]|uniref:3-oxoacyl-[acyl-carrier-protein] synthase 2 n=1 Tax=Parendozoicomonas haliclonae TaxID=1960125 RepID=A0A1X7ALX6_9GAMM|nr:beta-ketoacyl-ACP synthase II [Parendozoicomonas haliclonae]SMA49157.1 3-oxoacyl-[acyl-carrier-protein] synthase 2 [Parendozoicomonas haliclonae]